MFNTKQIILMVALFIIFLPAVSMSQTVDLPRTGQTTCYDENGNQRPCAGTGEDGEIQAGIPEPASRFIDNDDGTITDNLTGLIWLKDANCINTQYPGFDNDGVVYGAVYWQSALDFVAGINNGTYSNCGAGYTDWRLPNINELKSLINTGVADSRTWLEGEGFTNVIGAQYMYHWSSTTTANPVTDAWAVSMEYGNPFAVSKTIFEFYVWPVRAGQQYQPDPAYPANIYQTGQIISYATGDDGDLLRGVTWPSPRFIDNQNGTITDNLTGLMWLQDMNCMAIQYPGFDNDMYAGDGAVTWQHALDFIKGINNGTYINCASALAYSDWRLPNKQELQSIIDYSQFDPVLPLNHPFANVQTVPDYWTSSSNIGASSSAWVVDMYSAGTITLPKVGDFNLVWPVRAGTLISLPDITVTDSGSPSSDLWIPFSSVMVGNSLDQQVTITNDGNADLNIGQIAQSDPLAAPFSILNDNCSGQTIAPAANCTLTVRFSPTTTGTFNDSFDIPSDDPDENPVTVSVGGTGTATPVPDITVTDSVSPSSDLQIPFGSVTAGNSSDQQVTITNDGNADLNIGQIAQSDPLAAPFSILNDNCSGQTIAPAANCTLTVRFSPTTTGTFNDSFDIPSDDPDENPVTVSVNGTGLSSATNNPPNMPQLIYPADGEKGLPTTLTFRWQESTDPDRDTVSYDIYYCEDPNPKDNCSANQVASLVNQGQTMFYAKLDTQRGQSLFYDFANTASVNRDSPLGLWMLFFGIVFAGGVSRRKRILLQIAILLTVGMLLVSCGGGGDSGNGGGTDTNEVTHPASGLKSSTTYYWQVVAKDGNGGETASEVRGFTTQ